MDGVGKATLAGVDVSEEDDSDPDSSRRIWWSLATSAAASSSSLGEPRCLRARPIRTISSICVTKRCVDSYYTVMTHVSK